MIHVEVKEAVDRRLGGNHVGIESEGGEDFGKLQNCLVFAGQRNWNGQSPLRRSARATWMRDGFGNLRGSEPVNVLARAAATAYLELRGVEVHAYRLRRLVADKNFNWENPHGQRIGLAEFFFGPGGVGVGVSDDGEALVAIFSAGCRRRVGWIGRARSFGRGWIGLCEDAGTKQEYGRGKHRQFDFDHDGGHLVRCVMGAGSCVEFTPGATIILGLRAQGTHGAARFAFLMYFLYRVLTAAGMLVVAPYFALRGWRRGESSSVLRERLGILPCEIVSRVAAAAGGGAGPAKQSAQGAVWIHAVSVGEVLAAKPLVEGLKRRYPGRLILVSTTTETGQRLARERLQSADGIFYFPLDWVVPVRRALRAIRPAMVIIMETEIWPNFLHEAHRSDVPVIFANARISERSFARFLRWKFLAGDFFANALTEATFFLTQTAEDAKRLAEMGAPEEHIEVTGNLKYDSEPAAISRFGAWLKQEVERQDRWPIVVAGSVVEEEEESVLGAYDVVQRQWRRALLVLAPRKPDRFEAAANIVSAGGWQVVRRSDLDLGAPLDENADVLVLDSIGELAGLYSMADAAFVGGSLVRAGGHNILEPAWFGRPPVFGPFMENFREMAAQFLEARAGIQVRSSEQLGKVWVQLIEDDSGRERMGKAARELSERNRGATAVSLKRIAGILDAQEKTP